MKYIVNLIYDAEYRGYVADVPELPGCMSQGKTVEKALENVKDAIAAYRAASGDRSPSKHRLILSAQVEV